MATLDTLPADQRAVLQLVLQRGRSYDEIAAMLSIDRAAVRERALAALDALGPPTSTSAPQRALLTDYLLGQLPPRIAEQTRERLATSAADRAWARVVAAEIASLSPGGLPEIPPGRAEPPPDYDEEPAESGYGLWSAEAPAEPEEAEAPVLHAEPADQEPEPAAPTGRDAAARPGRDAEAPPRPRRPAREPPPDAPAEPPRFPMYGLEEGRSKPSSRRAGAVLIGLLAAIVVAVVIVIVLTSGGSSKPHPHKAAQTGTTATSRTSSSTSTTTTTPKARLVAQVNLNSPDASDKSVAGIARVYRQGTETGIVIIATGLAPNKDNAYAVWLYRSANDSVFLGFVSRKVTKSGGLQAEGVLPANASHYSKVLVTLETAQHPKSPGQVVLQGASKTPF
jgi:Sigma-70, region 4